MQGLALISKIIIYFITVLNSQSVNVVTKTYKSKSFVGKYDRLLCTVTRGHRAYQHILNAYLHTLFAQNIATSAANKIYKFAETGDMVGRL